MSLNRIVKDLLKTKNKKLLHLGEKMGIKRPNDITKMLSEEEVSTELLQALSDLIGKDKPEILKYINEEKEREVEERNKAKKANYFEEAINNLNIKMEVLNEKVKYYEKVIAEQDKIIEEKNKIIEEKNIVINQVLPIIKQVKKDFE